MTFEALIFATLATFRLAEMLVVDDGPFEIFINLRGWLDKPRAGSMLVYHLRNLARGLVTCAHCAGVWISLLFSFVFTHSPIDFFVFWFAVAGLQSILLNKLGRTA